MIALPNDDNTCGWYAALPPAGPAKKLIGLQKLTMPLLEQALQDWQQLED